VKKIKILGGIKTSLIKKKRIMIPLSGGVSKHPAGGGGWGGCGGGGGGGGLCGGGGRGEGGPFTSRIVQNEMWGGKKGSEDKKVSLERVLSRGQKHLFGRKGGLRQE